MANANSMLTSIHTVRPYTYNFKNIENPPPLPTTMPPMGQVIKTTSTFQASPNNKREFHSQTSNRPGVGQIGSRASSTITTSTTLTSPSHTSNSGNWQSGLRPVQLGSPHNVYGVNNNHHFIQHYSGNNSFLANERSAAASAAG